MLSCRACAATFATDDEHRQHYRSDFHRINLKRKTQQLPPLTFDQFQQQYQPSQRAGASQSQSAAQQLACVTCGKTFTSGRKLLQHIASRRHITSVKRSGKPEQLEIPPQYRELMDAAMGASNARARVVLKGADTAPTPAATSSSSARQQLQQQQTLVEL